MAGGKTVRSYRDLTAWQRSMDLAERVYTISRLLPKEEVYGLRAQLTRAAVSVACNIAEGQGRMSDREFVHFLRIARGSTLEVKTLLELIVRVGLTEHSEVADVIELADEVARLLAGLLRKLNSDLAS
ncbi:MAG: four helix bundle protein [Phycisphaerae bacterium]